MKRCGFNFLWMFHGEYGQEPAPPDERALDWLVKHGFDFVRVPTSYWFWTKDHDYTRPDERILAKTEDYAQACLSRGLHMSLNIHRAPGYCINGNHLEKHNLWVDEEAQEAFIWLWRSFAERFKGKSPELLSFDLLNEPPNPGQYQMTRESHKALMLRVIAAIREVDPDRPIVIDGLGGGHYAMPELADAGVIHSGRGYMPMPVSHHDAQWWDGHTAAPPPAWPLEWEGKTWNRESLREFMQPWRDVEAAGAEIHMGEFGCYNKTPNPIALAWLRDTMEAWRDFGWGWAMWNFEGAFGIVDHGRPGARWEDIDGYRVDVDLLELMKECRPSG
jgi:endoglucanase